MPALRLWLFPGRHAILIAVVAAVALVLVELLKRARS